MTETIETTEKSQVAAHTPGPWESHNNIGRKGKTGVVADGAPCIIAIMGNGKEWPALAQANAALISAAPELLEALKRLVMAFEQGGTLYTEKGRTLYTEIRDAKAAIAKAEGRE
jgi:hypothetical protein